MSKTLILILLLAVVVPSFLILKGSLPGGNTPEDG